MGLGLAEALRALGYTVLAQVETADELVEAVDHHRPELVLVDIALPGLVPAVREVRATGTRAPYVVLLADPGKDEQIVAGVCAGAVGSVPRSVCPELLRKALVAVRAGESLIPRALVPEVLAELRLRAESTSEEPSSHTSVLTTRERQVLEMMRSGMSTASIAEQLVVAPVTVRTHICAIRRKLHLRDGGSQHMSPLRAS
jgi:DNA-binding NarL/FixJ family response regulator